MKRKVLAVVVPALLSTGTTNAVEIYNNSSNKVDLYGKVGSLGFFSGKNGYFNGNSTTYVHLGLKGETKINDELIGYGKWEYKAQANTPETDSDSHFSNKMHLGFAGLKFGDFGSVDYGQNYGIIYDTLKWTDTLPVFGGKPPYINNFFTNRNKYLVTYRNTNFFGLFEGWDIAAQYHVKNKEDTQIKRQDNQKINGNGYMFSTTYRAPVGLGFSATYGSGNLTNRLNNSGKTGDHAEQWATALKYDINNIYLAAMYGKTRNAVFAKNAIFSKKININETSTDSKSIEINDKPSEINDKTREIGVANKTHQIELVAQYQFDFGLRPSISYILSKAKNFENIGAIDLVKYVELGATYFFNKNLSTYVDYLINEIHNDNRLGIASGNTVALGLTYKF